jgi:tetratricopeptide (TPR) repeat protein
MNLQYKILIVSIIFILFSKEVLSQPVVIADNQKEESDAESIIIDAKMNVFMGKYDVAIKKLEGLLIKDRTNSTISFELAKVYKEKNDWPSVQRYMDQALKNDPKNIYFLEYYTLELTKHPFDPEREIYFKDLIAVTGNNLSHYDLYLDYLVSNRQYENTKSVVEKLVAKFGETEKILQRNYEICSLTNCKERETIIKKLIAKDNTNTGYLRLMAKYQIEKNNQKAAQEIYSQILALDPNDTEANLAILKTTDNKKNAESAYLRTIIPLIKNQNIPIDEKIKELMPYLKELVEKEDTSFLSELVDIGNNLTLTHPGEAKAQAFYGDVLYASNNYKGAVLQYQKTLKLNDRNFAVWENLMKSLDLLAEYGELSKVANNAIDFFPNRVESYVILSRALILQDKINEAKDVIDEAVIISGGNPKFKKELNALQEMVKGGTSLVALQEKYPDALNKTDIDPQILEMLGDAAIKDGKTSLALSYYKKALEMGYHGSIKEKLFMRGLKL